MTGFGKTAIINQKTVEVKSLNSKGLDLNVRMPSLYREWNWVTQPNCTETGKRKSRFFYFIEVPRNKLLPK
jgi:uncharacterized protein YicC (UPF0701 family)